MRHTMKSLSKLRRRYAPSVITADTSTLSTGDQKALVKLIAAARLMDQIFRRQTWSGASALVSSLTADLSPLGKARLRYFRINGSPWSELDEHEPFISGVPERPLHANYYPDDMTKEEFESWVATLSAGDREKATGFFYVIRRDAAGALQAVPYSEEYRDLLEPAAALLREAADLTDNDSLKKFLRLRADAFLSNDYFDSDVAWMELDSPIEIVIGPYEVYMDRLFNYKAAFEAYITVRDPEHSAKLQQFSAVLQDIENNLPIDPRHRNPQIAGLSPILVANEMAGGGEANSGVRTAAFNLPNDERVVEQKGTKQVMLKNIQEAKFRHVLMAIGSRLLDEKLVSSLSFAAFFDHIVFHELLHGIGPHNITVGDKKTTVRFQMKDLHSAFEEAKADICSLFALQMLIERGAYPREMEESLYVTYLASSFRSVRFGIGEAHGRGQALQFNYLFERGAITRDAATGRFGVNLELMKQGVTSLASEILTAQAEGSFEKAQAMLERYGVMSTELTEALAQLTDIPIDIEAVQAPAKRRGK